MSNIASSPPPQPPSIYTTSADSPQNPALIQHVASYEATRSPSSLVGTAVSMASSGRPHVDDALAHLIPPAMAAANSHLPAPNLRCCCGRQDCVYLEHSRSALDNVEKDVHTAAKLGQALLARHEAYMADAERDRFELTTRIEQLEIDKRELQVENAKTVEENRSLLDQLEALNATVNTSDLRIQNLESTLLSSQQAVRRLEGAAARAEEMERHVALLEREQLQLQNTLVTSESEARSAMQRWKKAERGVSELQKQLERMEKETKDERERHVEAMGRMERRREMEKELNTAAGRLKGAAAAKSLESSGGRNGGGGGSSVVSHFVRDLLQDNANLQLGMAELREMLTNSNDEIQALRDQLIYHQPLAAEGDHSTGSTLRAELVDPSSPPEPAAARLSQEFHIHHHYHVAQKQEMRKPKKKRGGLTPGTFTPPGGASTPTLSTAGAQWRLGSSSPAAPPFLTHAHRDSGSSHVAGPPSNRWSVFSDQPSEFATSSVPSSPQSTNFYSMFDRGPDAADMPNSPTTSLDPLSPTLRTTHLKRPSEASVRSVSVPTRLLEVFPAPAAKVSHHAEPITEVNEPMRDENYEADFNHADTGSHDDSADHEDQSDLLTPTDESTAEEASTFSRDEEQTPSRRRLHRTISHESIMSLTGGLDIHTLKIRPSQLTLRPLGGAEAVFTGVTASSTLSRVTTKRSSAVLRDSLAGLPTPRKVSTPTRSLSPSSIVDQGGGVGKIGRWTSWRPWGGGTGQASQNNTPTPPKKAELKKAERDLHRASGINQPGAIPGFQEYLASHLSRVPPSKVAPDMIDIEALREGLEG